MVGATLATPVQHPPRGAHPWGVLHGCAGVRVGAAPRSVRNQEHRALFVFTHVQLTAMADTAKRFKYRHCHDILMSGYAYMQVNAFIVRQGTPGMRTVKIENKTALRCVQNADIYLEGAVVDEADRLPGVQSFKDTNKVLPRTVPLLLYAGLASMFYPGSELLQASPAFSSC